MISIYLLLRRHGLCGDDYDQYYIRDICPDGYKFYHIPRIHSTGGGVGVVLKDSFSVETIPCGHYGSFESIAIVVTVAQCEFLLWTLVRPSIL